MPLKGIIYKPIGQLVTLVIGLSLAKIISTSLPQTEGYAWHFGL